MGYEDIQVQMIPHHLIYGPLRESDDFNWTKKVEIAVRNCGYDFSIDYPGGWDEFVEEYRTFFADPRRFTYTPIICARGVKAP